jgi:hypothetical protein
MMGLAIMFIDLHLEGKTFGARLGYQLFSLS